MVKRSFFRPYSADYDGFYETWTDSKRNRSNTSTVGYVPLEKRVHALLQAGENLESMREVYYGLRSDDDDENFATDIVNVSEYDSKLDLLADVKAVQNRILSKKKNERKRATKGAKSVVDNSDAPKEAKEELSTTDDAPVSERATE